MLGVSLIVGLIFALSVGLLTFQLRQRTRQQIIARDAEVLFPVAQARLAETPPDWPAEMGTALTEARLLAVVLSASRLQGVIGARLFDPAGELLNAIPGSFFLGDIPDHVAPALARREPFSLFHAEIPLERFLFPEDPTEILLPQAVMEVYLPLAEGSEGPLLGIAHFLIDGSGVADELRELDRNLLRQSMLLVLAATFLAGSLLYVAFSRLLRTNKLLSERSQKLLHAHEELRLVYKTNALGGIAAHLVHGLKNPLYALHHLLPAPPPSNGSNPDAHPPSLFLDPETVAEARRCTDRMRAMLEETAEILKAEKAQSVFQLSPADVINIALSRINEAARHKQISLQARCTASGMIDGSRVNLILLILQNIADNALYATPPGQAITLAVEDAQNPPSAWRFIITDGGPGIPDNLRSQLFQPLRSQKPGGSGIGLAISRNLARSLGGDLFLQQNSGPTTAPQPPGATFILHLPQIPEPSE